MNRISIYAAGLLALSQPAFAANLPATGQFGASQFGTSPLDSSPLNSPPDSRPYPPQPLQQNGAVDRINRINRSSGGANRSDLGVQFDLSNSAPIPTQISAPDSQSGSEKSSQFYLPNGNFSLPQAKPNLFEQATFTLRQLFSQGTDSLVAVAVGNAEGTRTPAGDRSKHFYGHADPGNGVWNLGTFSYQHGAGSAEEADAKQLERLKRQSQVMQEKASAKGLKLTLEETLNGIDLANQAPEALLDVAGYIEWLEQAHSLGMSGSDAILWARVQSFIDPKTQRWNAPGLGNTAESITRDQRRRMQAIARAIEHQNDSIAADARLKPQPIGFRLPQWSLAQRVMHRVADQISAWFNWA